MKRYLPFLLCVALLSACAPAVTPAPEPTATPAPTPTAIPAWQVVKEYSISHRATVVGYNNPSFGITAGYAGEIRYTTDGGENWIHGNNQSMCRFGLEVVDDQVAWHCGNGGQVRVTTDGGQEWTAVANFGPGEPAHCRFLSFLDATTGWAATPTILASTADGAQTWTEIKLPHPGTIAAIAVYAPGQGYLLETDGSLYATKDNGASWTVATPIELFGSDIRQAAYPWAAMRFFDEQNGLIVVGEIVDAKGQMAAFRTADGGKSWTREVLAVPFGAPFLSRDGKILTLYMAPKQVTVIQYNGN